jgi:4-diphosphocytidyl-2-C-methyl-D-erythritol kinase
MDDKKQFNTVNNALSVLAPAKINLSLLIAGKRPDGYHEIETIMAKVTWYDEILISQGCKTGIELVCKGPHWAPDGQENLVYRAAKMFLQHCVLTSSLNITLQKNIPAGTGLGSASSDAAATLMGLNKFLKTGLDKKTLSQMAQQLGSDVPFFLNGPLAFCRGRGEKIKKIREKYNFLAILILPDINVSTKRVYANYRHNQQLYEQTSELIKDLIDENRIDLAAKQCVNMLQESCFELENILDKLKKKIQSLGIGPCCLSGSGSTLFCIFESGDESKTIEYTNKIEKETGCKSVIVRNNPW